MEDTTWEQRLEAITHILTNPTRTPTLYSQFFISNQIPCYLNWDYPPILCSKSPSLLPRWTFSLFLKRVFRLGAPQTSWRSKCPFQQPPPLILAKGVEQPEWEAAQRRDYARKRLARKPLRLNVNPLVPVVLIKPVDDPVSIPRKIKGDWKPHLNEELPDTFCGGWVGYFSYDTVRYVERKKLPFSKVPEDDRNLADIYLGLYDEVIVFDHVEKKAYVIHWVRLDRYASVDNAYKAVNCLFLSLAMYCDAVNVNF